VEATAVRSWWETGGAPHFTAAPEGFLADTIPPLPALSVREAEPAEDAMAGDAP